MINIRSNVFETNSSSTHSVTIDFGDMSSDLLDTIVPNNNKGDVVLYGGDFSEAEFYSKDALKKANFVAVWLTVYNKDKSLFEKVLKDQTGANNILYDIRLFSTALNKVNSYFSSEFEDPECSKCNIKIDEDDIDDEDLYAKDKEYFTFLEVLQDEGLLRNFIFNKTVSLEAGTSEDR